MDELLQEFIAETRETLEALSSELVIWENEPRDKDRLDSIFRFFHTVKGSCGFLNLPRFERLSHAAEDVLSQLRDGTREPSAALVDAILAIVDRIGELIMVLESGDALPDGDDADLIKALDQAGENPTPATTPSPTVAREQEQQRDYSTTSRSIRIPLDLIDHMMSGVSDMVLARNEVARCLRDRINDPATESAFERLSACIAEMRDSIGQTRMQRIERIFSPLPRLVRDLCNELGKKVELTTRGNSVELDREMIEMIRDPITHIIRNSIDHGIESAEERIEAGKPATGSLVVAARQSGNQILIEVSDDGRGILLDRLVEKAIRSKVKTPAEAQLLSDAAKLELIFAPGLSTADKITAISGRGVGMDVVRSNVERIGGSIDLENREGRGLKVTLRVPLTLTIIPCLTVRAGGQDFALPRTSIREILFESNEQVRLSQIGGTDIAIIRGQNLPHFALEQVLGLSQEQPNGAVAPRRSIIAVTASAGLHYAMSVEAVMDHEELVVRPGAPVVMAGGLYAGTTLPDNGRPMLLLDPVGLAARAQINETTVSDAAAAEAEPEDSGHDVGGGSALLFLDLQRRKRLIHLGVVERVEDVEAARLAQLSGQIRLQVGHESRPVFGLEAIPDHGVVKMLHLTDGSMNVHYAIDDIVDIVKLPPDVDPCGEPGLICGIALIGEAQIELVDPHWIFSSLSGVARRETGATLPLCAIVGEEDHWARNILSPLISAAGYRPVFFGDSAVPEGQSVALYVATGETEIVDRDAPVIRLSGEPLPRDLAEPGRIYRYDRIGLMAALESSRNRRSA